MSILLKFLTEEQIKEAQHRASTTESIQSITTSFDGLTMQNKAVLNHYLRDIKYPPKVESILGSKQESYNTEEEMLSKSPEYSFGELSESELNFYETYGVIKKKDA